MLNMARQTIASGIEQELSGSRIYKILRGEGFDITPKEFWPMWREEGGKRLVYRAGWTVPWTRYPGEGTKLPSKFERESPYTYRYRIFYRDPKTGEIESKVFTKGLEEKVEIGRGWEELRKSLLNPDTPSRLPPGTIEVVFEGWEEKARR